MKGKKLLINIFLICCIIGTIIWLRMEEYTDESIEEEKGQKLYSEQNFNIEENINEDTKEIKEYPKEQVLEQYNGYVVGAKLEIPAISLETYILKTYSVEALNISVTKFWGVDANEIGNYCVAGHNFQNKIMFYNLKNLKIGDILFISDNEIGKIKYEIYDIYKVLPKDVSCLSQETNGKREVTLITCTNDSKKRIIVKARESEV